MKNTASQRRASPLFEAVVRGELPRLKELLSAGGDPNEEDGPSGQRPLVAAAARGRLEMVQLLLEAGAPVDATDRDGNTALWKAVYKYDDESSERDGRVIDLLLDAGADPDKQNRHGVSPRSLAATIASTGIGQVLEKAIAHAGAKKA